MQGDNGNEAVGKFFVNFILFFVIILYLLILIFKNIYEIFKNFNDKSSVVLKTLYISIFMIIIFTLIWYFMYVSIDDFLKGLGWMTLDMALEETKMTPHQFFEEAIFGTNSNPICNGINMTEWFDFFLYQSVANKGFLSAIMTMQPNKSGTWMVEMFDIVNYIKIPTNSKLKPTLGICGNQLLGSGGKYYNNESETLPPPINGIIPKSQDCKSDYPVSLKEKNYLCGSGPEALNKNKICDINGCNDSNTAICMSCLGVPASLVCLTDKKINYSA